MRRWVTPLALGLALVAILAFACGSPQGRGTTPSPTIAEQPTPTSSPTATKQPTPTLSPIRNEPAARVLLLVPHVVHEKIAGGERTRHTMAVRPVDPVTLRDVEGYTPLDLGWEGRSGSYALSRDGRMVAVVGWHLATADREICTEEGGRRNCTPYTPEERRLHVVDLVSWTEKVVPAGMTEFYLPTFSEDNTGLYVIFMDPSSNKPLTHRLHRYDPNTERLSLVAELPIGFNPLEMRLLPSGDRLAMYGALGGIGATAHVVIVDVGQGRVLADVTLEGVRHGFVVSGEPAEGGTPLRDYSAGLAWDLDRERLYVVHADTDRVTVVDLAQGKLLKQANIIHPQSPLSRMLDWVSRPAYAKEAPGITRRVVLIPDGDRLYVTGTEGVWDKDTKAVVEQPLGLQIIATDDFRQLRRLDLPVSDIDLSPNGKWLLLGSSIQGNPNVPPSGLSVFDAQSMTEVAHLEPGLHVRVLGLSADGRYVYVSARSIGTGWKGDTMVKVLDLLSLEFKGTRSLGGFNPDQPLIGAQ